MNAHIAIDPSSPHASRTTFRVWQTGKEPKEILCIDAEAMEHYLAYLDNLRESGVTNMYGAAPYLQAVFDFEERIAKAILIYWMETFSERHPKTCPQQRFMLAVDESAPCSLEMLRTFQAHGIKTENLGCGQYTVMGQPEVISRITATFAPALFKCEVA